MKMFERSNIVKSQASKKGLGQRQEGAYTLVLGFVHETGKKVAGALTTYSLLAFLLIDSNSTHSF